MGAEVCQAVSGAPDLELVAAVDPVRAGSRLGEVTGVPGSAADLELLGNLDDLDPGQVDVAVEFTGPASVGVNLQQLLRAGIHVVVGATGLTTEALEAARELAATGSANAVVAPNFAIGAVLLMRYAADAARYLPDVEVVELHHAGKVDAPSGTALRTAELIAAARETTPQVTGGDDAYPGARGTRHHGVPVHSLRLPGLVAHQEVILGGQGQTLTLRHDSTDRSSFMPGVLLACRRVSSVDGLVVGLENLLD